MKANAQDAAAQTAPAMAPTEDGTEAEDGDTKNPMGWVGVGLKFGVGTVGAGSLRNPMYDQELAVMARGYEDELGGPNGCSLIAETCATQGRTGLQLTLAIGMGGDGFGWDLEPFVNLASNGTAFGLYTGPKFDIHVADAFYLGFGFGPKLAYVNVKNFDYGADAYVRVPVRGTYYMKNQVGLVAEVGVGYGLSAYASPSRSSPTDSSRNSKTNENPDVTLGAALTWDLSVGVRWP